MRKKEEVLVIEYYPPSGGRASRYSSSGGRAPRYPLDDRDSERLRREKPRFHPLDEMRIQEKLDEIRLRTILQTQRRRTRRVKRDEELVIEYYEPTKSKGTNRGNSRSRDSKNKIVRRSRISHEQGECPVCLESIAPDRHTLVIEECKHLIHMKCCGGLCNLTCPICRGEMKNLPSNLKKQIHENIKRFNEEKLVEETDALRREESISDIVSQYSALINVLLERRGFGRGNLVTLFSSPTEGVTWSPSIESLEGRMSDDE